MALIYDEERGGGSFSGNPISEWCTPQVMGAWRKHAENQHMLDLYLRYGTRDEKARAEKEMLICERKMKWWERHRAFDADTSRKILIEIVKLWDGSGPKRKKK